MVKPWNQWETGVVGQILTGSLLEPNLWILVACKPAITSAFWEHWETAVLGQTLARSLLEADLAKPVPAPRGDPCPKTTAEDETSFKMAIFELSLGLPRAGLYLGGFRVFIFLIEDPYVGP